MQTLSGLIATWLIYKRGDAAIYLMRGSRPGESRAITVPDWIDDGNTETTVGTDEITVVELKPIDPRPAPAGRLGLDIVTDLILKELPGTKLISHIGTHDDPFTYYLLVLFDDNIKTPEHEISNKIEDNCRQLINVFTFVHKASSAADGITSGNYFWNMVMEKGNVVYRSPDLVLPEHHEIPPELIMEYTKHSWDRWGIQGTAFFQGARRYMEDGNYVLAAFLLHQAAEATLMAIIRVLLGYRVTTHKLSRLVRISLLFTDELKAIFDLHTASGSQLFNLLQNAYSDARYKNTFDPDGQSVKQLAAKVQLLTRKAAIIYGHFTSEKQETAPR